MEASELIHAPNSKVPKKVLFDREIKTLFSIFPFNASFSILGNKVGAMYTVMAQCWKETVQLLHTYGSKAEISLRDNTK